MKCLGLVKHRLQVWIGTKPSSWLWLYSVDMETSITNQRASGGWPYDGGDRLPVEDGGRWQEAGRSSCSVFSLDCSPPHLFPYLQHQSGPEPGSVSTMSCPLNCSVRAVVKRRFPGGSEEGDSDSYCLIIFLLARNEDNRKQKSGKKSI